MDREVDRANERDSEAEQSTLVRSHQAIVDSTTAFVRRVDALFDHPRINSELAQSRIRMRNTNQFSHRDSLDADTSVSARVTLPNLSDRLSLYFSGTEEFDTENFVQDHPLTSENPSAFDSPTLGLRYQSREEDDLSVGFSVGLRARNPSVNLGPRLRYRHSIGPDWHGYHSQRILWDTHDGWESRTRFEFTRNLSSTRFFRQTFRIDWRERRRATEGTRTTTRTQYVVSNDERSAWVYEYTARFQTEPQEGWRNHVLAVRYRRLLYSDWLSVELSPFFSFANEHDWKPNPGLQVSLEVRFESKDGPD